MFKHEFNAEYDENSKVLILGSFPSVRSRADGFYYAHPNNRFWSVMGLIFEQEPPKTIEEKKAFLICHRIALWDVVKSCDVDASSDSSIKNVTPNNISLILEKAEIKAVYANGQTAFKLYNRYIYPETNIMITLLPSTSPANASISLKKLYESYSQIKYYL